MNAKKIVSLTAVFIACIMSLHSADRSIVEIQDIIADDNADLFMAKLSAHPNLLFLTIPPYQKSLWHIVAEHNAGSIALYLCTTRLERNAVDSIGWTPLHYAARENNATIIRYLMRLEVPSNILSHEGLMPIHVAAQYSSCEAIVELVSEGADINAETSTGETIPETPLFIAIKKAAVNPLWHTLIKTILDQSGSRLTNSTGTRATDLAQEHNDIAVLKLLQEIIVNRYYTSESSV